MKVKLEIPDDKIKRYFKTRNPTSKEKREIIWTLTKKWFNRLMWFCCLWVTWSYVLASLGREEIAQELSKQVVCVILGAYIPYLARGFLDSWAEARQNHQDALLLQNSNIDIKEDGQEEAKG